MTHYNEPIEEFLENARWRLFDAGHYRHAEKLDEVLDGIGKAEELEETGVEERGELHDAKERIGELECALRAVQDCILDNRLDDVDGLADAIMALVKEAL